MGALADALSSRAELVFADAPSLAANDFGWWHAVEAERDPASDDPGVDGPHRHSKGWARTRDAIVATFAREGPFDGVIGFSQGAALAALLVGLRGDSIAFDFAILVGGFSSNDPELAKLYDRRERFALPSVHVMGRADGIVPIGVSRDLARRFSNATIIEHDGGHVIPRDAASIEGVRTFVGGRP
jgi:pimeloyl-ACP methyl ester carboxylesterase